MVNSDESTEAVHVGPGAAGYVTEDHRQYSREYAEYEGDYAGIEDEIVDDETWDEPDPECRGRRAGRRLGRHRADELARRTSAARPCGDLA